VEHDTRLDVATTDGHTESVGDALRLQVVGGGTADDKQEEVDGCHGDRRRHRHAPTRSASPLARLASKDDDPHGRTHTLGGTSGADNDHEVAYVLAVYPR
jgi:hypothetical protein